MDAAGTVLVALMALWLLSEYRRRERRHARVMSHLRRGLTPPEEGVPRQGRMLFMPLGLAFLLAIVSMWMFYMGMRNVHESWPFYLIGTFFLLVMVLVVLIVQREYRARHESSGN
jgi:high-affinity Fe2+/Pb2+ permease